MAVTTSFPLTITNGTFKNTTVFTHYYSGGGLTRQKTYMFDRDSSKVTEQTGTSALNIMANDSDIVSSNLASQIYQTANFLSKLSYQNTSVSLREGQDDIQYNKPASYSFPTSYGLVFWWRFTASSSSPYKKNQFYKVYADALTKTRGEEPVIEKIMEYGEFDIYPLADRANNKVAPLKINGKYGYYDIRADKVVQWLDYSPSYCKAQGRNNGDAYYLLYGGKDDGTFIHANIGGQNRWIDISARCYGYDNKALYIDEANKCLVVYCNNNSYDGKLFHCTTIGFKLSFTGAYIEAVSLPDILNVPNTQTTAETLPVLVNGDYDPSTSGGGTWMVAPYPIDDKTNGYFDARGKANPSGGMILRGYNTGRTTTGGKGYPWYFIDNIYFNESENNKTFYVSSM